MSYLSSQIFEPNFDSKFRLMSAIHKVEEIFITYSNDSIVRVIQDLRSQMEQASSVSRIRLKETALKESKNSDRSRFEVKMSLQFTVSLFLNDIRNFAKFYKEF